MAGDVARNERLRAALAGRAVSFQAFNPTVKGAPRWWDTTVSPIVVEGKVVRVLATSRDVTGARLAESQHPGCGFGLALR